MSISTNTDLAIDYIKDGDKDEKVFYVYYIWTINRRFLK